VVENESPLPITVSEKDMLAVGVDEEGVPSLDACAAVQDDQRTFCRAMDWTGAGADTERIAESARKDQEIVIVTHLVPRFSACTPSELSDRWKGAEPLLRIITLTFQAGGLEYLVESADDGFPDWHRVGAWGGQTVFTFPCEEKVQHFDIADQGSGEAAAMNPETTIPEGELMFHIHDDLAAEIAQIGPLEDMCAVCEMRPVLASCGCCEKPAGTCGACCLLRHTEGRYQVHKPDETSTTFEQIAALVDSSPTPVRLHPSQGLVLVAPFDGIGGARRAIEILGLIPALYIGIDHDEACHVVIEGAWPEAVLLKNVNDITEAVLADLLRDVPD